MRTVTRNFLLGMGVIVVLLLALGALPGFLKSGDPYYLTATAVDDGAANDPAVTESPVDAGNLSAQRYPYTTEALDNATADTPGRSAAYWRGPVGIKGAFTHSPFDEFDALTQQYPSAVDGDGVVARHDGTFYRLAVTQSV